MPGGKHGTKAVFDDDYDDYDDYDDKEYYEEDEGYEAANSTPQVEQRPKQNSAKQPKAHEDDESKELNELLSQLIPNFSDSTADLRTKKHHGQGNEGPDAESAGSSRTTPAGGSALAKYLTQPPPLRPSGKAQKAGRPDLAAKVSQEAAQQPLTDPSSLGVERFRFDQPSPDDLVLQAQKGHGSRHPSQAKSWLADLNASSAAGYDVRAVPHQKSVQTDSKAKPSSRDGQAGGADVDSEGWQKIPAELLNGAEKPSQSQAKAPQQDPRTPPQQGYGGIETDSEGWQKLPLHMEMAMMQQAAKGEDGVAGLQAEEKPRDRWWKEDRNRQPDPEAEEPSLRAQSKAAPKEAKRPALSEYVMDPDLQAKCMEAAEQEKEELKGRTKLHLVVLGHVDAGKSTLMGRLLHELGAVSQKTVHKHQKEAAELGKASFAWAWLLDERPQERARGVTIDVASAHFQTPGHSVTLLDAPGHRDFVPNMIAGAAQADAAILLVDGSRGGFEAGFEASAGFGSMGGGQTREHAQLARSLGVDQMAVVISKLDTCEYSQTRYEEIKAQLLPFLKQCGFREGSLQWLPAVGTSNENLATSPTAPELKSWWSGPTLVQAIDRFRCAERNVTQPLRLPINDVFKGDRGGQSIGGKIEAGAIKVGSEVRVMPSGEEGAIKSITIAGKRVELARAGDSADVTLTNIDAGVLGAGAVLCHPQFPVPLVSKLEARIVVLDVSMPLLQGQQVTLHAHAARETGFVSKLVASVDAKTGETSKKKPRVLLKGQSAVIEVTANRPMCLELYSDCRALGRVVLREGGQTLAVGIVVSILD